MPIIIRELVIQANITNTDATTAAAPAAANTGSIGDKDRRLIIEEAVQQVMEILERQKDR
jgi:hypothetical protein